ncbi:MAG: M14 family zinc carboxypeptidase [Candidatus Taylorbacteria bacterium]|nr:M14 family zinc carboxypeptidase [Candidatus Taylorbacteria bacterium]
MKKVIIAIIVIALVGFGFYYVINNSSNNVTKVNDQNVASTTVDTNATSTKPINKAETVIGKSVENRDITAYHYGTGTTTEILFVGGIHGGYEWNTVSLSYSLMDYLKANPSAIPANLKVTVIPVLNPDGLNKTVGTAERFSLSDVPTPESKTISGRFNANDVDLNRNFNCDWQANAKWQSKTVSGGSAVFSEPESLAVKNYIETQKPEAVVVYYSAAGGVFSSSCHNGILPETNALTNAYAKASGYPAFEKFDFYATTGDMVNWLAKINVPAISVLLTNHNDVEWNKNLAGVKAIIKYYTK